MIDVIVGIDPGLTGAIAVISVNPITCVAVHDIPTILSRNETKKVTDLSSLSKIIREISTEYRVLAVLIELVASRPDQGVVSVFSFGFGTGLLHGVCAANGLKIAEISPAVWKADLNLTRNKADSLHLAKKIFPESAKSFEKMKHNGRAEAALIAYFGIKFMGKKK